MRPAVVLLLCVACAKAQPDPLVIETRNGVEIRREVLRVKTPPVPANPVTGTATPASLDAVHVVRYRVNSADPKPARAVLVLMPGFLGGAGTFDALARAVVARSTADAPLEAWAIDRRANALEDHRGIDAAVDAGNADVLTSYYFEKQALDGETFAGFERQEDVAFESEWGVVSTLADLRAVLQLLPEAEQRARVVLAGHSLGATLVAQYAAWDFDGAAGADALAGLVLIDGVTGDEGKVLSVTREQYETTGIPAGATDQLINLAQVRSSSRYVALPLLEASLFPIGAGTALRATLAPDALQRDVPRAEALKTLFLIDPLPRFTNRAAFGLAFDFASCPVTIASVNAGASAGGALVETPGLLGTGTLVKPADSAATYTWREYDAVEPRETTSLSDFALTWLRPGVDFGEWYFPTRLSLDSALGASLTLSATDWPVTEYGVRALHGRALALPVLVEAAGILGGDVAKYDGFKGLLQPVGAGRPLAGAARSVRDGYEAVGHAAFSHIDPLAGADVAGSASAEWYDALAGFMLRNTPAGGVAVVAE